MLNNRPTIPTSEQNLSEPGSGQIGSIPKPNTPNNPYEFIMVPPEQQKKAPSLAAFGGKKPLIVGGSLGVVLVVLILLIVFSGGNNSSSVQLANLAAEQQEIIRVSDLALKLGKDSKTLAVATTIKSSVASDQAATLELYKNQGGKLAKGQISSRLDKKTDDSLNSAAQSNTLNAAYQEYLEKSLANYRKNLKALYEAGGPKTRAFADKAYSSSGLVLVRL